MARVQPITKTELQLGPFTGGINTYSDASYIADNELVDCINFEVDLDGCLVSRPPIKSIAENDTWIDRIKCLGRGFIGGTAYILGCNTSGTWVFSGGSWTLVTDQVIASCVAQYNNALYFLSVPGSTTVSLGKWTPDNDYEDVSNANLATMMGGAGNLGGNNLFVYKDRLFIVPGNTKEENISRLIFSDAGNAEAYSTTTQFIDVNPGDGESLNDLAVYDDNLFLFKTDSTYVLSYTGSPSNAELLKINPVIGCEFSGLVVAWENSLFVLHRNKLYEIYNYTWTQVNVKMPFVFDATVGAQPKMDFYALSLLGERLLCRIANNLYVYGLRTKTWSRWESQSESLQNIGNVIHLTGDTYIAGSCLVEDLHTFEIKATHTNTDFEELDDEPVPIVSTIVTKNYDLGISQRFKKLFWWGVDARTTDDITGTLNLVSFSFIPTWGTVMNQETLWQDMETWGTTGVDNAVTTTVPGSSTQQGRRFYKFPTARRFRQLNFTVSMNSTGIIPNSPVKLFSLTAVSSARANVPDQVN